MGQAEVIKILEKERKWMSLREIAEVSQTNRAMVGRALATLFKHGEVFRKKYKGAREYIYYYK